jgi:hypothetical protein
MLASKLRGKRHQDVQLIIGKAVPSYRQISRELETKTKSTCSILMYYLPFNILSSQSKSHRALLSIKPF